MPFTTFDSPIGELTLVAGPAGLRHLYFPDQPARLDAGERCDTAELAPVSEQLKQYFSGERQIFELRLDWRGTPFQRRVWRALREIPYGTTTTYGALARRLGLVGSGGTPNARAVGAAVGATPVPIVIPCHRVIGADGSLTGYGGGLERKRALLDLETAVASRHSHEPVEDEAPGDRDVEAGPSSDHRDLHAQVGRLDLFVGDSVPLVAQ